MEEIKVGEYIRTKDGIKKIVQINEGKLSTYYGKYIVFPEYKNSKSINIKNITKHSPNIIDLIEVGDYVNGKLIHKVDIGENYAYIYYGNCKTFTDHQIQSIVTKEQFKNAMYEV